MRWVFPIVTSAHQEKTNFIKVEDIETVHQLSKQKQSEIKRKFPYDVLISSTKSVLKYSENVDNQSDSGDSTDSSLSSSESIQSSLKSVTTNNHGNDFRASPKCLKCTKHKIDFGSMGDYKTHNIKEHPGNFHCSTCGKGYSTEGQLQNHINAVHLGMVHKCPVVDCEVYFLSKKGLNNHLSLHKSKKDVFLCNVCGLDFESLSKLKYHKICIIINYT